MSDDRTLPLLDEAIAAELREHGTLLPPWLKHPDTSPLDLTWRMGAGEWYLMVFWKWSRGRARDAWIAYFRAHAPIPPAWAAWAASAAHLADPAGATPEVLEAGVKHLAEEGLVDLDAWRRLEKEQAGDEPEG